MEKPVRVTVLVYVHNAEKYLIDCLKSLSNQILDDMEIICINDGSTDESADILKNFATKEPRMRVIELKKSAGYGRVLNRGIKLAGGEYIGIIEATDFINPEMFIELFALAKKFDADVAKSNYFIFDKDKDELKDAILPEEAGFVIDPMENTRIFYQPPAIWSAIYKKSFLEKEKIGFLETSACACQDISFNVKILASGGAIVLTDKPYLHHRPIKTVIDNAEEAFNINEEFAEAERYLKKKDVWKVYGYIFEAVKFASYHWNMLNLKKEFLEKFALRMRAEFHDADNKNMLRKPYFPKNHWRMLRVLLDTSPTAFLLIFKNRNKKQLKSNNQKPTKAKTKSKSDDELD